MEEDPNSKRVSERAKLSLTRLNLLGHSLIAASLALSLGACRSTPAQTASQEQVRPTYDGTGHLTKLEYASKGDGKVDTWAYMNGTHVVRLEADENGDGKIDRWEYHGDLTGRSNGAQNDALATLERVEEASHYDGKVDKWEYYVQGQLSRIEEDTDGDGKVDKWETYTAGALTMMALDTARRGKPDRRLMYRADGTLDRIETDPTGSGQFQPLAP